ncbi:MAG: hypothetical protein HY720_16300 [Planctomycetes bacterium]|nr:hypothetical protein [Planctomycetota bacterium]
MAQMLYEDDSSQRHLDLVRRHQRRCRKTKGAAGYASKIEPARAALEEKVAATRRKREAEEDAGDDHGLADELQDDNVTTVWDRAGEFDRDNPGAGMQAKLFPSGRRTDVTEANIWIEPDEVDKIVSVLAGLPEDHPLRPLAEPLGEAAQGSRAAGEGVGKALRQRKLAEGDEELAAADVRRAYERNYLNARDVLGRKVAERLFVKNKRRAKKKGSEGPAQ